MGRIVVTEFVSIDGVFEDPGGAENYEHGGWTFEYDGGDDFGKFKFDELMEAEAQLLGRLTYDEFVKHLAVREGSVRGQAQRRPEVRRLQHAHGSGVAEHDRALRRRSPAGREAQGRDERDDPRPRQRSAGRNVARRGPGRRAPADGLPDGARPGKAALPRRDRSAEAEARRVQADRSRTASRSTSTGEPTDSWRVLSSASVPSHLLSAPWRRNPRSREEVNPMDR